MFSNQSKPTHVRARPRVVIGHPYLGFGGSESVVMWLIEALKHDCDVTVLTTGGWDLSALNAYYGTRVDREEVQVRIASVPAPLRNYRAAALRGAIYQRFARRVANEYDVRISAYNFTDWGAPANHFIADFSWRPQLRDQLDPHTTGYIYRDTWMRRFYLRLAHALERPSGRNLLRDDIIVANSHWSSALVKERFGVDCAAVLYPPVWEEFPTVPWEEREASFVMIGRIAPEKRIEYAIEILDAVRRRGHPIKLHLCGKFEGDRYARHIARLCDERKSWIIREGHVRGPVKRRIMTRCRFGIQARGVEPFGISVAEMVKAGEIVFAPGKGGQTEILASRHLLFDDSADAVDKISTVLASAQKQEALRTHLAERSLMFSADRFTRESLTAIAPQLTFDPVLRSEINVASEIHQAAVPVHQD